MRNPDATDTDTESSFKRVAENLYRAHNGRYYALVKRSGKQMKKSLGTTDRKLADRKLKEFLNKADRVNPGSEHRNIRFDELAAIWLKSIAADLKPKSLLRRKVAADSLAGYFGGTPVRSLALPQIEGWKARRSQEVSARSWNIEMETLRLILRYAHTGLRITLDNPAESLRRRKETKSVVTIPSRADFERVIRELRNGHRATGQAGDLVEFLAYSGCRIAEARGVRWRDIDWERKTILITGGEAGTKNHEQREVPLFPALAELLLVIRKCRQPSGDDESVFRIQSAIQQLGRASARLGLPKWTQHSMRHFFCSNAIESGIDFKTIAHWVGHKDGGILVAKTYGHLRREFSDEMALKMTFRAAA